MSREETKESYEKEVFLNFVKMTNLHVNYETIKKGSENNNEPDIICKLKSNKWVGFELGRLTDKNLRQMVNKWEPINGEYLRTKDNSEEITNKKLNSNYSTEYPTELILYKENPIITPDNVIIPRIKPMCQKTHHNYSKIWFMGNDIELLYESS